MKIQPSYILAAVLAAVIVFLLMTRSCGSDVLPKTVTVTKTDTIKGDPYPVSVPVRVPVPYRVEVPVYLENAEKIDTHAVIRDYYSRAIYTDTLKNDTSMLAVVHDTIFGNRIVSRQFTFQNRRPTAIITNTTVTHNRKEAWLKLYLGVQGSYSPTSHRFGVGPFATATIRQGAIINYGYDVAGNAHQVGFGWKLSFRKRP